MARKRKGTSKRRRSRDDSPTPPATATPPASPPPRRFTSRRWLFGSVVVVAGLVVAALAAFVLRPAATPTEVPAASVSHEIPEIGNLGELDPRFAAAVGEAVAAIRRDRGNGALYGRLGTVYHAHKYYAAARRAYEIAVELDPDTADWPYYVALLASGRGETEVAAVSLRRVLELEPDDLAARLRLANLLFGDGRLEAADDLYRDLGRRAPQAPWGWVGQAKVKRRQGG